MFPDNLLRLPTLNLDSSGKYLDTCKTVNQVRENRPTPKGNLQDIYIIASRPPALGHRINSCSPAPGRDDVRQNVKELFLEK